MRCLYNLCLFIYIVLFKYRLIKGDFILYIDDLFLIKIFFEIMLELIYRNKGYLKLVLGFFICRYIINMMLLVDDILIVIICF